MSLTDLVILIPSHSLEDFPTELGESESASLLNAFAVAWHPRLLATSGVMPSWQRADEPADPTAGQMLIAPTASDDWLSTGWAERAREAGAHVVSGISERQEMIEATLGQLGPPAEGDVDPDLVADFLALGSCYLQMELLTRHMHHFGNQDEVHLQREAVLGAEAAVAGDAATARTHLKSCFESLHEARERFYPVDCYLLDLCLLVPEFADEHLRKLLLGDRPFNLLLSGADAETIAGEHPDLAELIREAWSRDVIDVAGGDHSELPVPLVPLESLLWDLNHGRETIRRLFGREPTTWARRRFGLNPLLPQLLSRSGYHSALHFLLDDGLYPDTEQSKVRWEGCDGTVLDAMSRIPLAAEGATGYLRFAMRMAESMEEDQAAALMLARWPKVEAPWFDDLVRMHGYAPCLGRFVTLDDFFQHTDTPGRLSSYSANEYLTPFLTQSVASRDPDPLSRYGAHFRRRAFLDAANWCGDLAHLLRGQRIDVEANRAIEAVIEEAGVEGTDEAREQAGQRVATWQNEAAGKLADVILDSTGSEPGLLIVNPLSFSRTVSVPLPQGSIPAPGQDTLVRGVQAIDGRHVAIVDLPGCGFAWLATAAGRPDTVNDSAPLVEAPVLRNKFFEVHLNEKTGGIARIKGYGRQPNVLSQQLTFRFPNERTFTIGNGENVEEITTWYSDMVCHGIEVTSDGPYIGELVSHGDLVDQQDGRRLAGFRQRVRTNRFRPSVDVEIELDIDAMPEGDPWSNYFASRFAFSDSTAAITRSVLGAAQPAGEGRFESPHFVEIADESTRVTINGEGLPFYRTTGMRMIDSLLVSEGEVARRFTYRISMDQPFPMQDALDLLSPPLICGENNGPPRSGPSGWFFQLDTRSVQILRILDLVNEPSYEDDEWAEYDQPASSEGFGFAVRLQETEGRQRSTSLRCWRTPTSARQRDLQGRTLADLPLDGDAVRIDLTAYEIADIELRFEE